MTICIGKIVSHLVQTDAGIEAHAEILLHLRSFCLPTCLGGCLTAFQILGIVLPGQGDGFGAIDVQCSHHQRDDEIDLCGRVHPKIGGEFLDSPTVGNAGIGKRGAGIGLLKFQDAQFGLGDTGYLIAPLGDGIDGVARCQRLHCHLHHILCQGEGKEFLHGLLTGFLDTIYQFLLSTFQLQRLDLPCPLQGVIEEQILLIANGDRDGHKLRLVLFAERTQVAELGGTVELSAPAFHRLCGGDTGLGVEQALLAIHIDIFNREIALGHVAFIHHRCRLQCKLRFA